MKQLVTGNMLLCGRQFVYGTVKQRRYFQLHRIRYLEMILLPGIDPAVKRTARCRPCGKQQVPDHFFMFLAA